MVTSRCYICQEHGWADPDKTDEDPPDHQGDDKHYDDDNGSYSSETEVKRLITCSDEDVSDSESTIKMMDDRSSVSNSTTDGAASIGGDKTSWEQQRKAEYEMMTNMLNVYRKRLSSYGEGDFVDPPGSTTGKEFGGQLGLRCDDNENVSSEDIHVRCALDRDAKIKQERLKKPTSPKELDNEIAGKITRKKNSFRARKHQIQKEQDERHHRVTDEMIITRTPEAVHKEQMSLKRPVLTYYHKSDTLKSQKPAGSGTCEGKHVIDNVTSGDVISSNTPTSGRALRSVSSLSDVASSVELLTRGMSIDTSSGESEETLVAPSPDGIADEEDHVGSSIHGNANQIVINADVHRPNGRIASSVVFHTGNTSATSTLSSDGSISSAITTPKNMTRLDVDHNVESYVVRSGKQTGNGGIFGDSYRINTPPCNLKDYSEAQTLLGRSRNRNKNFARHSGIVGNNHHNSHSQTVLRSLTDSDLNTTLGHQNIDLKDYFPKVGSTSSRSSSSGNISIQTCSSCGSKFTTPCNSLTENMNESSTLPVCEQCACTLVHYRQCSN